MDSDGVAAGDFLIESASLLVPVEFGVYGWEMDEHKLRRMSNERPVDMEDPWECPPQHDLRELALQQRSMEREAACVKSF